MKLLSKLCCLLMLASGMMFTNCTSEYVAIAGKDGVDGVDGLDGLDGADGTAVCVDCHSSSHRMPIVESYELSTHFDQTVMYDGSLLSQYTNRTYCAECHTDQGYIEYQETGAIQSAAALPTGISCTTCHDTHDSFDFENDGPDYALRYAGPTTLKVDENYHIDYGNTSNNCIQCHQPRRSGPVDDGSGEFMVTSSHWGPHYGAQSTLLEGLLGSEIAGSTAYPDVASSAHRNGASCVSCHMGETTDETDGAHSMLPTDNACVDCHSSGVPEAVTGYDNDIATLEALLAAAVGWEYQYEVDGNGDLVLDPNGDPIMVLDGSGDPVTIPVTGIIVNGSPNTGSFGQGATFSFEAAQAAWNYRFLYQDHSHGVHNPEYAKALISNSIEALQD